LRVGHKEMLPFPGVQNQRALLPKLILEPKNPIITTMLEHFSSSADRCIAQSTLLKVLGLDIPQPSVRLANTWQTKDSLTEYLTHHSGNINNLISEFKKKDADLPEGLFVLSSPSTQRENYFTPTNSQDGRFYADGNFGFALGHLRDGDPLWLAAVSFCESDDLRADRHYFPKAHVSSDYFSNCPLIVQIQACEHPFRQNGHLREEAREIMAKIRWEKLMITLVTDWAAENHMPAVYLLPGEFNRYCGERLEFRRALMRYNVTAERMGFIKEASGLYALHLAYAN